MKKSFLFLLISIMTVFLIAGCADNTTKGEETTPVTEGSESLEITYTGPDEINFSDPETLVGAYELTFFYTDGAKVLPISTDCTKVEEYTGTANANCIQGKNNVDFTGYGNITLEGSSLKIITKMQMTNTNLQNGQGLWGAAKDNQYSYTVFKDIPTSNISTNDNIINSGNSAVKGTSGRTLTKNVPVSGDNNNNGNNPGGTTYTFELDSTDKFTLINKLTDKSSVMPADVTVIMKKISNTPIADMKKDKPLPTPVITGFVASPQ